MMRKILTWFNKNEYKSGIQINVSKNEETKFILKVDKIRMGILYCKDGDWYFKYCKEFKDRSDEYNRITGFPDLDKTYKSKHFGHFFKPVFPDLNSHQSRRSLKRKK